MVHAYLMYGFPTETAQETVDALERVRQLFDGGLHPVRVLAPLRARPRTARSACSPSASASRCAPPPKITFARNDVAFDDPDRHATTTSSAPGLRKALYNYMHGVGPRRRRARRGSSRRAPAHAASRPPPRAAPPRRFRRRRLRRTSSHTASPSSRRADRAQQAVRRDLEFSPEPGKRTLADYVPIPHVYPAGRLDTDSEGLLLLTDDGALQARIANPRHKLAKTYWAQVEGLPTDEAIARAARRRRSRRLRHEAGRRPAHRRARRPLAARPADPLPREDPDGVARAHAARRQESPGQAHDGPRGLPDAAPRPRRHRQRRPHGLGARRMARGRPQKT